MRFRFSLERRIYTYPFRRGGTTSLRFNDVEPGPHRTRYDYDAKPLQAFRKRLCCADNLLKSQEEWTGYYGDSANHRIVSFTYDEEGDRATVHYPSGITFGYHYTGRKQLDQVYNNASPSPPWVQYTYDASGNRKTRNLYYGANTTYDPADALNRIKGLTHTFIGGQTARFDYDFDKVSRLLDETRDTTADGFSYDLADQTANFVRDGTWNGTSVVGGTAQNYTFDANGNRTVMNSTNYTSNNLNQYTAITGVPAPTYDNNGNLKTYNGWTYTYDATCHSGQSLLLTLKRRVNKKGLCHVPSGFNTREHVIT